jgi:signal transduction histidine kinase
MSTVKRAVEVIERNAQSQLTLISDMLDMARISSGKIRLEFATVNMASVVAAAMDGIRPAADAKSIRLVSDLPPTSVEVSGDSDRLQQIVWNLLSNAVKFTGDGGMVVVSLRADDSGVHLTVADTGQGIDRKFLSQVFDRFKQADTSAARRAGGLGLGLALVKDLVSLHGGHVAVESPGPGLGATFAVHLPNPLSPHHRNSAPPRRTQ